MNFLSQHLTLRGKEGLYLMERTHLRRWTVERRVIFWSSCNYVYVARDFVGVVSMSFLMVPMAPITTGTVVPPHSLNLDFRLCSVVLTEVLVSRGIVISMRRKVFFPSHSLGKHDVWPFSGDGPFSVDGHVPQNGDTVLLSDSLGFLLITCTIVSLPQSQTLCRSFSACVQLPCCGGACIQF